jgi:hypothetical protein
MQIDHVLIAVADLGPSARAFEAKLGVTSVEGGRHPQWGTANRIVPLGDTYLELVSVADPGSGERHGLRFVGRTSGRQSFATDGLGGPGRGPR